MNYISKETQHSLGWNFWEIAPDIFMKDSIAHHSNDICPICYKQGTPKFIWGDIKVIDKDGFWFCGKEECITYILLTSI